MRDLSPAMRLLLATLDPEEGTSIEVLRRSTVLALMRRGKVELSHDGERVFLPSHEHEFKGTIHMDGCHYYSWAYACDCGASMSTYAERSLADDPYSAVWMEDVGGPKSCERCGELMAGARARYSVEIVRPRERVAP